MPADGESVRTVHRARSLRGKKASREEVEKQVELWEGEREKGKILAVQSNSSIIWNLALLNKTETVSWGLRASATSQKENRIHSLCVSLAPPTLGCERPIHKWFPLKSWVCKRLEWVFCCWESCFFEELIDCCFLFEWTCAFDVAFRDDNLFWRIRTWFFACRGVKTHLLLRGWKLQCSFKNLIWVKSSLTDYRQRRSLSVLLRVWSTH